jgi:predicted RNA-binding protein Jag
MLSDRHELLYRAGTGVTIKMQTINKGGYYVRRRQNLQENRSHRVSPTGIEAAIESALSHARKSVHKMSWFEVEEIHGHIGEDGKISNTRF